MDPRVHLEMGLLRLVNAARLAPLEELLAEAKGASGGNSGGGAAANGAGNGTVAAALPSRSASAVAGFSTAAGVMGQKAPASLLSSGQAESGRYKDEERPATNASSFGVTGTATAVSPALEVKEKAATSVGPAGMIENEAPDGKGAQPGMAVPQKKMVEVTASGLDAGQVGQIKAAIAAQQKFIGELLEHSSRWELDGMELRIYFPAEKSTFAGLIEGRDTLEKIRGVSGKVLGRAVRVCAKLETGAAKDANASRAASSTQEIRAQFENDPMVKSMLQRFGGRISEVRRAGEE
jgi:hypothetical protein